MSPLHDVRFACVPAAFLYISGARRREYDRESVRSVECPRNDKPNVVAGSL